MEDGRVTNFNMGSSFMHPGPTCCTRVPNIVKYGTSTNHVTSLATYSAIYVMCRIFASN